jgi:hypothetical protein
VSNEAFRAIRRLLVPYAKHFAVWQDDAGTYDLEEDLPHARTMFGYAHASRDGARLVFYPLNVFEELRAALPPVLASKLRSKYVLSFATVTAADRAALAKLFAAAWALIAAQRELVPGRAYYRKPDVDETMALLAKLASDGVTITRRKHDIAIVLPLRTKVPAVLAARQLRPGTLRLKTVTPAEYHALAKLLGARTSSARRASAKRLVASDRAADRR